MQIRYLSWPNSQTHSKKLLKKTWSRRFFVHFGMQVQNIGEFTIVLNQLRMIILSFSPVRWVDSTVPDMNV